MPRPLWLVLSVVAASAAGAQQPPSPPDTSGINGFLNIRWGATAKDITSAFGVPLMDRATGDTGQVLIYKDQVQDRPVVALFYLHPFKGLVKGLYNVPYGPGKDCETTLQQFKSLVQWTYLSLPPVEERKHEDPSVPFCDAAAAGKASWSISWSEPESGNSVRITLEPDEQRVYVTYRSGADQQPPPLPDGG
ncbi:MAG: hypothetical protein HY560_02795 [Gemmatimonadetes bacterium]|nr:hypothetical protein [Gemmatimonadota bacterium]